MSSTSIYTVPEQWRLQLFKNPPEPISHYDLDELWQTCVHELFQTVDHWGENNPHWGIPTSEKQKKAVRLANSVPKPWISESAKQQHKNGTAYKFNVKDCAKGGKKTASRKWYNNGKENKYITDGDCIPEGFVRGRITGWNTHP